MGLWRDGSVPGAGLGATTQTMALLLSSLQCSRKDRCRCNKCAQSGEKLFLSKENE